LETLSLTVCRRCGRNFTVFVLFEVRILLLNCTHEYALNNYVNLNNGAQNSDDLF
jgi:hypothetical protein